MASRRWPTKLVMSWEAVGDVQLCTCRNQVELLNTLSCCCTVVAIWNLFWDLLASEPSSDFRRNHFADSIMNFGSFWETKPSRLVCMFQDSVPAGSYNDPFLSSVCVCCHICIHLYTFVTFARLVSVVSSRTSSEVWVLLHFCCT